MRIRLAKFIVGTLVVAGLAPACFAPDTVTLKILEDTGSRVALEDPLTFNAGTIVQGLIALGHTDPTPRQLRTTTNTKDQPATLETMTVPNWADWPYRRQLTPKSTIGASKPPAHYYPNVQEPAMIRPTYQRAEYQGTSYDWPFAFRRGRSATTVLDGDALLRADKPQFEKPNFVRPDHDYSGPPLLFTMSPALLRSPLFANDPEAMRLFVRTNEAGKRDALTAIHGAQHIRRLRPASFWDGVEASNNPRADYQDGNDYEAKARNIFNALGDLRDPSRPQADANDPRPSYDSRTSYNPNRRK